MPETPEQQARREIDRQLTAAGWLVQSLFGKDRLLTLLEELNTAISA